MASSSEKGHAKNIANANLLNTYIVQLATIYNPSNPSLLLPNLQTIYTNSFTQQETVNTSVAPYSVAVNNREIIFAPVSKKITKLRKVYKATEGVTQPQLEDFMTIARKLKGIRKVNNTQSTDPTVEQNQHSTSQLSYDQRTNNMDLLISLFQNTPNYSPNEIEYKITTLQAEKAQMLQATQNVANTFVPLNNARSTRNNTMYNSNENLVDTFNKAKDYLFTILDSDSVQYKAISKIKFKKV
jgi:sulfite reductase alpha subunit-like flavoprotein